MLENGDSILSLCPPLIVCIASEILIAQTPYIVLLFPILYVFGMEKLGAENTKLQLIFSIGILIYLWRNKRCEYEDELNCMILFISEVEI